MTKIRESIAAEQRLLAAAIEALRQPVLCLDRREGIAQALNSAAREWLRSKNVAAVNDILAADVLSLENGNDATLALVAFTSSVGRRATAQCRAEEVAGDPPGFMILMPLEPQAAFGPDCASCPTSNARVGIDALTGLADRRQLFGQLETAWQQQPRDVSFALFFVDLDGMKRINDRLGHLAGDAVLAEIAGRLSDAMRPSDLVARYGGDEFMILVEGLSDLDDARSVADRIQQTVSEPVAWRGELLPISASIGIALSVDGYDSWPALLEAADRAMYEAKARGGGNSVLHPPASPR